MNMKKIVMTGLAISTVATMCLPALANKTVPSAAKVGVSKVMKSSETGKVCVKDKTTPVISKKGKKKAPKIG